MDTRKNSSVIDGYRRFEKIYDRCAYKGCANGKINGHHLFKFPAAKDPRQPIWIKHCSRKNDQLRSWSASTLRRAGLCRMHFAPESFVIGNDAKLNSQAIPLSLTAEKDTVINYGKTVTYALETSNVPLQIKKVGSDPSTNRIKNFRDLPPSKDSGTATSKNVIFAETLGSTSLKFVKLKNKDAEQEAYASGRSNRLSTSIVKVRTKDILVTAINRIVELQKANKTLTQQNNVLRRQIQNCKTNQTE